MSEPRSAGRLGALLRELHEVLDSAHDLDEPSRDALRAAASQIQSTLDETSDEGPASEALDALRERLERFEGSHPALTEAVRRLVDQLSEMGI
jgi:cytochrome c556